MYPVLNELSLLTVHDLPVAEPRSSVPLPIPSKDEANDE